MKQNFKKFVVLPAKRTNRGFDITFNGEERELEKIVEYITLKLDRNNKLYHSHTIK